MYKKIIFIAITVISIAGCRKDEVNVQPTNQLNSSTFPKSVGDLATFLTPAYANFRSANLYGYEYLPLVLSCDHTLCSQNSSGNPLSIQGGEFLTNNIGLSNTPNAALFSQLYQGVAYTNVFLDRARYYGSTYGTRDSAEVKVLLGQAYFLRAYYFYMLECFYGQQYIDMNQPEDPTVLGISMPLYFASSVPETNLPRSSAYAVWTQITADLEESAKDLHGYTYPGTTGQLAGQGQGRITEWAADGMIGKAMVFTKRYDSAKVYLLKVINDGVNSLVPFSVYKNSFNGNTTYEFNSESLFEINVDRQEGQSRTLFYNYLNSLTTDVGVLIAPTIIASTGVTATGGGDGTGGTCTNMGDGYVQYFVHDQDLKRFGFKLPVYTYGLNKNAVGPNSASNPTYMMDSASYVNSLADRTDLTKKVDPRLYICALEPWVDSVEQPYIVSQEPPSQAANFPDTIPVGKAAIINTNRTGYWGWSIKKYATTDDAMLGYGDNDGANLLLLRLADVYLLYAEACENTSDPVNALLYINKVHERAFGGSSAYDYTSLTQTTYADPSDATLINDPLKYERYVELFGEGGWWFDVCRWGIGSAEANYYVYGASEYDPTSPGTSPASSLITSANWTGNGTNSKAYHFPIPGIEMSTNTSIQHNNYPY